MSDAPPPPSPKLAELLAAGRDAPEDAARVARVASRLDGVLDAPAPHAASWPLVAGVTGAIVVAGAVALWLLGHHQAAPVPRAAPPPPVTASVIEEATPIATASSVAETPAVSAPPPPKPAVVATKPAIVVPTPSADPIEEHHLLARAERTVSTDPAGALALVDEHAKKYPQGMLASERELLRVKALVKLGRTPDARAARDRFDAAWPTSPYRAEIDRLAP
jgi:hypothetical protein